MTMFPRQVLVLRNPTAAGRIIGTEPFVPDLAKLASLYDAKGFSVTRKDELRPMFQQALATDDFVVVDVKLD